jgi:hypothetical protein
MVPALSTTTFDTPAAVSPALKYCSARGDLQMFPVQTVKMRKVDELDGRSKLKAMLIAAVPSH